MFDEERFLIIDKNNNDITSKIVKQSNGKCHVQYKKGGKIFQYNYYSFTVLSNPTVISDSVIRTSYQALSNIDKALKFGSYIKVFFENKTNKLYTESELSIEQDLLSNQENKKIFTYLNEMAKHLTIKDIVQSENEVKSDNNFLQKIYEKIALISEKSVLKNFFSQQKSITNPFSSNDFLYPFSFNLSQQEAIKNAFNNNISIIEGPPGTGKTQTILNIIANAILNNKTVAVLSNNNSATDNVFEKLEKHGLSSLAAKLGKAKNIDNFISSQNKLEVYPDSWCLNDNEKQTINNDLFSMRQDIHVYLTQKNEIAISEQELEELKIERKYFKDHQSISKLTHIDIPNFNSSKLHKYLLYLNKQSNNSEFFNKKVQVFSQMKFRFLNFNLYKNTIEEILETIEATYYDKRIEELEKNISEGKQKIVFLNLENVFEEYTSLSMKLFKSFAYENYNNKKHYDKKAIKTTENFIKEYPVILSTTYSLLNCVSRNFLFDYVIIDESSQVDLVSSFPALSLAKNTIIVGDSKQLPNIIDGNRRKEFNDLFEEYGINEKYNYTINSLLTLTKNLYEGIPSIILKEHYRCHPKIINFCNKKFYDNELIVLSKNNNSEPIKQYKCVKGNHARKDNNSWSNDRQAQVIIKEIIPNENINIQNDSIGIITPYKLQKKYLIEKVNCKNISIDTVHGFQGREKDTIIFSTVANDVTEFLDNPNSINVAVSRAINKLYLVTPYEYKSANNSNISNLISYISYNNFEVIQSQINSVFDLLYKDNTKEREKFLNIHLPFSKYPSETIMYHTILKILEMDAYKTYSIKKKVYPLRKIVKDRSILNEEELKFIRYNSHIDFLIYNRFDKMPLLAIEVDGSKFHNKEEQINRDRKKDSILKKCNIPLLRLKTNECSEEERIKEKLDDIIKAKDN